MPHDSNGQHQKPVKPTRREHAERIAMVRKMLASGVHKGDIKRAIKSKYGVGHRTCEKYLARARQQMLEDLGKDRDEHRADAYAFYRKMLQEAESELVRIRAQEGLCKLLALNQPERYALTDVEGTGPAHVHISIEQLRQEVLDSPDYLEFQRQRLLHEGNGESST